MYLLRGLNFHKDLQLDVDMSTVVRYCYVCDNTEITKYEGLAPLWSEASDVHSPRLGMIITV